MRHQVNACNPKSLDSSVAFGSHVPAAAPAPGSRHEPPLRRTGAPDQSTLGAQLQLEKSLCVARPASAPTNRTGPFASAVKQAQNFVVRRTGAASSRCISYWPRSMNGSSAAPALPRCHPDLHRCSLGRRGVSHQTTVTPAQLEVFAKPLEQIAQASAGRTAWQPVPRCGSCRSCRHNRPRLLSGRCTNKGHQAGSSPAWDAAPAAPCQRYCHTGREPVVPSDSRPETPCRAACRAVPLRPIAGRAR